MLDKYYKSAIEDAVSSLKDNGVVIVPTDTVYGLACVSSSKEGIERIYEMKNRDKSKILPIVVNSYKMLNEVIDIDLTIIEKLSKFFPGALTIVAKRRESFDYQNVPTIAVRMIESPLINELIERVNEPLCLTSANISNEGNIVDPMELLELFDGYIDCVFLADKVKNEESTIIEILDDNSLKLIREGKISFEKILKEYSDGSGV